MDLEEIRAKALRALSPLKAADGATTAPKDLLMAARRTDAGRNLPPYYLVYFLLVDLLGFRNLGRFEKLDWSVPLDLNGRAYLVEHRKSGVGVFAADMPDAEDDAAKIVQLIGRGVHAAKPYLDWRAAEAVKSSHLNVENKSGSLFKRFSFLAAEYEVRRAEAERRADEVTKTDLPNGGTVIDWPARQIRDEAKWLALSTIESFFSWTEHVFILIAILQGRATTGEKVAKLALDDWGTKFKAALDVSETQTKIFYDQLVALRQQVRNFVAHGAFGKQGEAFRFHSDAGAVPVQLVSNARTTSFRFGDGVDFIEEAAITLLHAFIDHLWSGARKPSGIYIQDWGLPLILTMAADGTYARALASTEEMETFARHLGEQIDNSANMDW
jgi:hypothetical protein